jgi:hypothetical protein
MTTSEILKEITERVVSARPNVRQTKTNVNIKGAFYKEFQGGGNAHTGFVELFVSVGDKVHITLNLDPSPRYDCFRPNPHYSVIDVAIDGDYIKAIDAVLEFSNNLQGGSGKITLDDI